MLFDLRGHRRRVVQAVYLLLAVLMGGGLVLFGIGGDVSGGLFDAFSENKGGGGGNSAIEQRIERDQKRLQANPRDEAALKDMVRANYQLVSGEADPNTGRFPDSARDELQAASRAWERYLALDPKRVEPSLAFLMLQVYALTGLNQPAKAVQAAEIAASERPSSSAYVQLTLYASLAGQTRKAELAGRKAIELAPEGERSSVRQQVEQAKAAGASAQAEGSSSQR
jgi:tetratricopeptide (TPR) repeat protein